LLHALRKKAVWIVGSYNALLLPNQAKAEHMREPEDRSAADELLIDELPRYILSSIRNMMELANLMRDTRRAVGCRV
jgi:hypothetical protein